MGARAAGAIKLDLGALAALAAALKPKAEQLVAKGTLDVEARAKALAPVDTGNLKNSIGSHAAGLTGVVAVGADYGAYVEWGTTKTAAQPYLGPAVEAVRPGFEAAAAALFAP